MIDVDLRIGSCIDQFLSKIRPKITAISRTRRYYSVPDLISQFKTHIWELIEMNIGDYIHACISLFDRLDHAQNRFLCELNLSTAEAFLEFNFAPPNLRRNVAVLGLLPKRVISKCHPVYKRLFSWYSQRFPKERGFGHVQLNNHCVEIPAHQHLYNRSFFPMTDIYNNLPQHVVDAVSVATFQKCLTHIARTRCQQQDT